MLLLIGYCVLINKVYWKINNNKTLVECFNKENPIRIVYKGDIWIKIDLNWKILNLRPGDLEKWFSNPLKKIYCDISWKIFMENIYRKYFEMIFKKEWIKYSSLLSLENNFGDDCAASSTFIFESQSGGDF